MSTICYLDLKNIITFQCIEDLSFLENANWGTRKIIIPVSEKSYVIANSRRSSITMMPVSIENFLLIIHMRTLPSIN